jgi:membrane-associated phospholipid phosphatase
MPVHRSGAALPGPATLEAPTVAVTAEPSAPIVAPAELPAPPVEVRALAAVQRATNDTPLVPVAVGMSRFGDHAMGWLALGALGALVDRRRRRQWLHATAGVAAAHGASIAVKRVVRRPRPDHPDVVVHCGTPSRLSFPSAHATSTTAAAMLFGALLGGVGGCVALVVPPMAVSRLVLGVHYPTDVVAGAGLGAAVATVVRCWGNR